MVDANLNQMNKVPFNVKTKRVLIIAARANDIVVERLISGAERALNAASIKPEYQQLIRVSGALEIPLALKMAACSNSYDAFVVLGAIIKGKTDHYDHVARMANNGVLQVALEHKLALGNGILTVHCLEHAQERADGPSGNLGFDAANASLSLLSCAHALSVSRAER